MAVGVNRWCSFAALIPATALLFMDQTVLPVALPAIKSEVHASNVALQWTVNAYLLAIAIFVLVSGKISDRIGHRNIYSLGLFGFAVTSVLCALAQSGWELICARFLQGASASFLFPAQTALLAEIFPPHQRGKSIGLLASAGTLFLILGPLIGGFLTQILSWRWIFWINLPIALTGLAMIYAFLPKTVPHPSRIDTIGFFLFSLATAATTVFFMQVSEWGWSSPAAISCAIIAVVGGFLLILREKQAIQPFFDASLFKNPTFASINVSVAITQFVLMISVSRTIYLQEILFYTPIATGILTFVSGVPNLCVAPLAGFLSDRISPKLPIAMGYLLLIFSFFWFFFFKTPSPAQLLIAFLAFGMGIPLLMTPSFSSAMLCIPPHKRAAASGIIMTLRMLSGTIGLSLIQACLMGVQKSEFVEQGKRGAEITSFAVVHFALGCLLILAFAAAFILYKRKSAHHLPEAPAEGWD